jgi:hypothetical protein
MFSDHLPTTDNMTGKKLLLAAAALVVACQLTAMVLVSQGQVEKAQAREVSQANARAATAWCVESSHGIELRGCAKPVPEEAPQVDARQGLAALDVLSTSTSSGRY